MVQFTLNNSYVIIEKKASIINNLKYLGKFLPRFCFHDNLPVAGNCRACLVELSSSEKPIASCVTEIEQNFNVWTDNPFALKARENIFSFLLANHPLDCPICDQAGECDLQDQTKNFANNSSRFFFKKRGVVDKTNIFGLKTIMTRCIHCTRCVRFTSLHTESLLGIFNRGHSSQIGQYFKKTQQSKISINVMDYCPVVIQNVGAEKSQDNIPVRHILIYYAQLFFTFLALVALAATLLAGFLILYFKIFKDQEYLINNLGDIWKEAHEALLILIKKKTYTLEPQYMNNAEALDHVLAETYKSAGSEAWSRPNVIPTTISANLKISTEAYYEQAWINAIARDLSVARGLVINAAQTGANGAIILPPVTIYKWNQNPHLVITCVPLALFVFSLCCSFLLTPGLKFFSFFKKDMLFLFNSTNWFVTLLLIILSAAGIQWFFAEIYFFPSDLHLVVKIAGTNIFRYNSPAERLKSDARSKARALRIRIHKFFWR